MRSQSCPRIIFSSLCLMFPFLTCEQEVTQPLFVTIYHLLIL